MKKILITQRVELMPNIGERRDALSQEWGALAETCGFLPLPIPNCLNVAEHMVGEMDVGGILLTGGNDLARYGGDAPERDAVERMLVSYAVGSGLPLLGVCRGMQVILDYFGMKLKKVPGHVRTVHALDNGREVNSFHAMAAEECASPLRVLARSADGMVEEVAHEEYPNLMGIMWHPERYHPFREEDIRWIRRFYEI